MTTNYVLNPDRLSSILRGRVVRVPQGQVLLSRFHGNEQEKDITSGINCNGYGRLHRYNKPSSRWSPEPIPEQPAAWRLGLTPSQAQVAQLFQIAGCDFRCWYCFVDRDSLSGLSKNTKFTTAEEIVECYIRDNMPSPVIVLTGGQPDIAPEWTLWMMRSLKKHGLSDTTYLWQDDNLSCGFTWEYLSHQERDEIRAYSNYGRCCCLKSFTPAGFTETTGAHPRFFDRQFELLERLVKWEIDVYVYVTFTVKSLQNLKQDMSSFMDRLQFTIHHNIPLRVVPLEIRRYTPVLGRLTEARIEALNNQYHVLHAWQEELYKRFTAKELGQPIYTVDITPEKK